MSDAKFNLQKNMCSDDNGWSTNHNTYNTYFSHQISLVLEFLEANVVASQSSLFFASDFSLFLVGSDVRCWAELFRVCGLSCQFVFR